MDVRTLLLRSHQKRISNLLITTALRILIFITFILLIGLGVGVLHEVVATVLVTLITLIVSTIEIKRFRKKYPGIESTALLLDNQAGTKERMVSLLELENEPDTDPRKKLIAKQLEKELEDTTFEPAFPLAIPRKKQLLLLTLPFLWFFIGWHLAPRFLYPEYSHPISQSIQELIKNEEDQLPEPLKESLTELAEAIDANELNSDEVAMALENASSALDEALQSLTEESLDNERVIEANETGTTEQRESDLLEQKKDIEKTKEENNTQATPTPAPDRITESKKEPTPTPKPEKQEDTQQSGDSEEPENKKSEAGDDQKGDGDGEGQGSQSSDTGTAGDGTGEQQDSSGAEQDTETSAQSGSSSKTGKGEDQNKEGKEAGEEQRPSEGGDSTAQTQPGKQESKSGGKQSETEEQQTPSEAGKEEQGSDGTGTNESNPGASESMSKVQEKLDDIKKQSQQGGGADTPDAEKSQKEIDTQKNKTDSEKKADKSNDEDSQEEGKESGSGSEQSAGENKDISNPQNQENSENPPEFNDAAQGTSGASTQSDTAEEKEPGEGEAFGNQADAKFNEVHVGAEDEAFDTRYTGKDIQRSTGSGGGKYAVELEDIELAKPEVQEGGGEQKIPLEYKGIFENQ